MKTYFISLLSIFSLIFAINLRAEENDQTEEQQEQVEDENALYDGDVKECLQGEECPPPVSSRPDLVKLSEEMIKQNKPKTPPKN